MAITIVQRNKSKGVLTWYARVPDPSRPGAVHYFSLGTSSKAEAKALLQARIRDGSFDERTAEKPMTLGEAVERYEKFQRAKGDKPAKLPLCPRLRREIERFESAGGNWEKLHCNEYSLTRIAAQAFPDGFPGKAHAHRFRHSFGSNLIRAGVNIKVVQTLMRHESIQMTLDIYGHIMDSDAEDAIAKAFP